MKYLLAKYENHDYVKVLDQVYLTYGVAIENGDLRIFPSKLKQKITSIPESYRKLLENSRYYENKDFPLQSIKINPLLNALSELGLECVDASTSEGLFAWQNNACIYYKFEEVGDAIKGRTIRFSYQIAGQKVNRCNRLNSEFSALIERLYGPTILETVVLKKKI